MGLRADVAIFAVLLAGSAAAVTSQMQRSDRAPRRPPVGAAFPDVVLRDIGDRPRSLHALSEGKKATVLYFWSLDCPCVDGLEPRLQEVIAKYEPLGVEFVAIDSYPGDEREAVLEKMGRLRATKYRMLLDPDQTALRAAGARTATEVVVLDAARRIRYRGTIDDDLTKPTVPYLASALDAVLQGRAPTPAETSPYGCPYPGYEGECAEEQAQQRKEKRREGDKAP